MDNEALIEKYFSSVLNDEELLKFENLYNSDANFKSEVDFQKDLKRVIRSNELDQSRAFMKDIESDIKKVESETQFNASHHSQISVESTASPWFKIGIAAAILIVLGSVFWLQFASSDDLNELYSANYETYPNYLNDRSAQENNNLTLQAFSEYERGNYQQAIQGFEIVLDTTEVKGVPFYLGLSYLEVNNYEKGIKTLEEIIATKSFFYKEAEWYLALGYLKKGDREEAIQALEKIKLEDGYNANKAIEILNQLKS